MNNWGKFFSAVTVIGIAVLIGLLIILRNIPAEAVIALFGVLVGSLIAGIVQSSVSEANRRHQLRLAALDKRLQAHQEAFTLWRKLVFADKHADEFSETVMACQTWWNSNCLYLTPEAREAFKKAYLATITHRDLVGAHAGAEMVAAAWEDIHRAGKPIIEGVGLPSIGNESKDFDEHF